MTNSFFRYSWLFIVVAMTYAMPTRSITPLPASIKTILDNHTAQLEIILQTAHDQPHLRKGRHVYEFPWLPGYLIKYGVERFYNAEKLKVIIRVHKLDLISVATKYLYHVPGRSEKIADKNYLVIVKKVMPDVYYSPHADQRQILNLAQIKQLCTIALIGRHYDLHTANYIISQGKLVIIDTDRCAMPSEKIIKKFDKDRLTHGVRVRTVANIQSFNDPLAKIEQGICRLHTHYDDAAKAYIIALIQKRNRLLSSKK